MKPFNAQMFEPFWDAVCHLERCSFKVLALTYDDLSVNRRLFQLHKPGETLTHTTLNLHADDVRYIFLFLDPTSSTRNAWGNKCRNLWVSTIMTICMSSNFTIHSAMGSPFCGPIWRIFMSLSAKLVCLHYIATLDPKPCNNVYILDMNKYLHLTT